MLVLVKDNSNRQSGLLAVDILVTSGSCMLVIIRNRFPALHSRYNDNVLHDYCCVYIYIWLKLGNKKPGLLVVGRPPSLTEAIIQVEDHWCMAALTLLMLATLVYDWFNISTLIPFLL